MSWVGPHEADDWLTCECCGSTDDERTNGHLDLEGNYVNLCAECVAMLTPPGPWSPWCGTELLDR